MRVLTRILIIGAIVVMAFVGSVGPAPVSIPIGPEIALAADPDGTEEEMSFWDWVVVTYQWLSQNGEWMW